MTTPTGLFEDDWTCPGFVEGCGLWNQGIWSEGILLSFLVPFFCSAPGGAILPFSNRGHERKRFFPAFLSSLLCRFLLFDRAAGFLPPRP